MPTRRTATPRTTDPWRAKLLKQTPHALMQLELRADGVVALCHCGWESSAAKTEGTAKSGHTRHAASANA